MAYLVRLTSSTLMFFLLLLGMSFSVIQVRFKNFLGNITQFATIGDSKSHRFVFPSGVFQGGDCITTVFILVVNVIATQNEGIMASLPSMRLLEKISKKCYS